MPFHVVIPSASAANLTACVQALRRHEPHLPPSHIVVVDDGARAGVDLPGLTWVDGARPFNFARNINRGLACVPGGAFLLNDDAQLATPGGFTALAARADRCPALCSAAIRGLAGNPNQLVRGGGAMRAEPARLVFICVFLPRELREAAGPLDERFTGYGFEDDDYSRRVLRAGYPLSVFDGCVVEHGELPSSFRKRPDHQALWARNDALFRAKWAAADQDGLPPPHHLRPWSVRISLARDVLPAAALDRPRLWSVALHDAAGAELLRQDAGRAELARLLAAGGPVVIERQFHAVRQPAAWTVWFADAAGRWLHQLSGAVDASCTA